MVTPSLWFDCVSTSATDLLSMNLQRPRAYCGNIAQMQTWQRTVMAYYKCTRYVWKPRTKRSCWPLSNDYQRPKSHLDSGYVDVDKHCSKCVLLRHIDSKVDRTSRCFGWICNIQVEQPENFPTCLATKPYARSVLQPLFKHLRLLR